MSRAIVETHVLTKRYGSFCALDQCSLAVSEGEVFGLLGPNGAGKTTLIRLLMGYLKPTSGTAEIDGLDCYRRRVAVHRKVSYLPGEARMFRTMRGRGVLKFFSEIRPDGDFHRAQELSDRLELDLSRWVGFMSTGMRQKLALAASLSFDTPILILDEPTANLDPNVRGVVLQLVDEARSAGRTVIFSSHVLSEIEDVCDRVGILRAGKLVHVQSIHQLKRQHRIRARVEGEMPAIPDELKGQILVSQNGEGMVEIETPDELSPILGWLAGGRFRDVYVQGVGLRVIYEHYHQGAAADDEV